MTNPTCPYPEFVPFIDDDGDEDLATLAPRSSIGCRHVEVVAPEAMYVPPIVPQRPPKVWDWP